MNPNKALWATSRASPQRWESGEAFAKGLSITKGLKVLDLGCGDGKTALPEAKLGAAEKILFARETFTFNSPGTPSEFVATFRNYYGPTMNAFDKSACKPRDCLLYSVRHTTGWWRRRGSYEKACA